MDESSEGQHGEVERKSLTRQTRAQSYCASLRQRTEAGGLWRETMTLALVQAGCLLDTEHL